MSIPASFICSVTPRTISAGASDLETNGMVLTKCDQLPADIPAVVFGSASAVSAYFGPEADETVFAQQYFTGLTNQQKAPTSLVIARRIDADAPAWLRGGEFSGDLAALKKITDGALTVTIDGTEQKAASIDLSSATSLSDVASRIATALTTAEGSYDSNTKSFRFTSKTKGESSTITYGKAGDAGTDLSALLRLTQAAGAVLSQGAAAMTEAENLDRVCAVTANWSQFTTLWEVTEAEEAKAFSAWADIDDDFVYVFWSSDRNMTSTLTQGSTVAAALSDLCNCTFCIFASNALAAAFAIAYPATIKWDAAQGMKVIFGKAASGLTPEVTDQSEAEALDALKVSYVGQFATRNDEFTFANRGALTGSMYGFYDVLIGSIWLRSKLQTSIMNGFASVNRAPYNETGYTMLRSWCQDPINAALKVGVIDPGVSLSESQKSQIQQETGDAEAASDIQSKGYCLRIQDPEASVRAQRGSPVLALYYAYGGSIQKADLPVTAVL